MACDAVGFLKGLFGEPADAGPDEERPASGPDPASAATLAADDESPRPEAAIEELAAGPRCSRCGCAQYIDVAIHGGRSTRRDCARCGRFLTSRVGTVAPIRTCQASRPLSDSARDDWNQHKPQAIMRTRGRVILAAWDSRPNASGVGRQTPVAEQAAALADKLREIIDEGTLQTE